MEAGQLDMEDLRHEAISPFRSDEKIVAGSDESTSAPTLQEPDDEELHTSSEGLINARPQTVPHNAIISSSPPSASCLGRKIMTRRPRNWYQVFYIRMDRVGSFSMYPNLGGPFQSVHEADDAIDRYLDELQRRTMSMEQVKLSHMERFIHEYKHYLDGIPKRGPNSPSSNNTKHEKFYLAQALIHQYNEDHDLFGDHAHKLEDLVGYEWIYEEHRWYYHFNFTTKKKEGNDNSSTSNLFFAEVSHMQGEKQLEVNCCCMIKLEENGHCYGCRNNGSPGMKHPNNTDAYTAGHLDGYLPFGGDEESSEDEEAEDERLRARLKGLDDPNIWDKIRNLTPRFTAKRNPGGSLGSV